MSIPDRLFRLSKAYLNQVRDRIDSELSDAERELDAESGTSGAAASAQQRADENDHESMMRRAEERIAAARRDLESRTEAARAIHAAHDTDGTSVPPLPPTTPPKIVGDAGDPNYHDYRVLGVPVGGDLAAVQAEYEKLSRRCDPRRFPDGSAEQKQAEQILARINTSYEALRRRLDPTENRFGKLELE